jgi:enediyne biosynthesis protein E4
MCGSFWLVWIVTRLFGMPHVTAGSGTPETASRIVFRDVGPESGVNFRFFMGSRGKHDLPEIMGGGVALFDADGDGRLDIYLCNGGPIDDASRESSPGCRLFRKCGGWRFQDASASASAPGPRYAMGAAAGDYDNDGRLDLFVTGWREQRLYRKKSDGRFEDVTVRAGVASATRPVSSAWRRPHSGCWVSGSPWSISTAIRGWI